MLTTSIGTLTVTQSGQTPQATAPPSAGVTIYHFTGVDGLDLGNGRWRFTLETVPIGVQWVDYDGALLYQNLEPGFIWDGSEDVDVIPPGGTMPGTALIHLCCSS